jgi:hypothetical protein
MKINSGRWMPKLLGVYIGMLMLLGCGQSTAHDTVFLGGWRRIVRRWRSRSRERVSLQDDSTHLPFTRMALSGLRD